MYRRSVIYRAEKKSLQILLSSTQAGPSRKVKQEQEESSCNHVQTFSGCSVYNSYLRLLDAVDDHERAADQVEDPGDEQQDVGHCGYI